MNLLRKEVYRHCDSALAEKAISTDMLPAL